MSPPACCTCASLLPVVPRASNSSSSEKPAPDDRRLSCCGRIICGVCLHSNPRFSRYCPYCQTSGTSLPFGDHLSEARSMRSGAEAEPESEGDHPPPYSAVARTVKVQLNTTEPPNPPPPYSPSSATSPPTPRPGSLKQPPAISEKGKEGEAVAPPGYTIHHLRHPPHPQPDTLASLSLRYGVPVSILRQHNRLPSDADYLLAARNTLLIPTAYITGTTGGSGVSLSPHPVEDAAERERKILIRRFMVACKEADYDAAVVYLEESGYDFEEAVARHREDAEWERRNPLQAGQRKGRYTKSKTPLSKDEGSREGGGRSLLSWLKG